VRLLLDTHTMYRYIEDDPQLSGPARTLIQNASNEILISPASYWEIAERLQSGKVATPDCVPNATGDS
jgi:PIN domain nuclease of toxin-antitoxin system